MKDGQSGAIDFTALIIAVMLISVMIFFSGGVAKEELQQDRQRLAIAYVSGLCAIDGPRGPAFYCGNWGFSRKIGELFYRCGMEMVGPRRTTHRLHVAQFDSEEEAMSGTHPTNAVSCNWSGNVFADDPKEWNIPSLKNLQFN